ncbi:hypothetical protein CFHF_02125 [Caulobacter flavus]|uniref:Uncharacterized protein n=1 Tax=Caulobacter flavus TaxID=1679497 RepID=A0A2N5D390_9CAUL|nr:hypothetical protein [Caulobacter flavus]AYV48979.1 hypothetical protein C1707_23480 [Caulobacter flavus]PLR20547.1 hypothetical protein CFHF_02125 [Caulobacter flavus]
MSVASTAHKLSPRARRALILMAVGAPVGFAAGRALIWMKRQGYWRDVEFSTSDVVSLGLATFLVAVGLVTVLVSLSRKALGRRINGDEAARAATPAQASFYAGQGGVLVLAAGMLAAPPLAAALFVPLSPLLASAVMTGLIALFLVQTAGNITLWVRSDELMRRTMAETAAVSYGLLQGLLFLWAAGERLFLLPALTLWDAVNINMIAYLLISMIVAWRRGFVD